MSKSVGQAEVVSATIRSNEFTLSGLSDLKFEISDYSITSGQPWQGIANIECNDSGCSMFVMAGRKASTETADWFARAINPGSAIGCATTATSPKELNFAFKGKMVITFYHGGQTYTGQDIVIAQGSQDSRNNWWIGGPNMSRIAGGGATAAQTFEVNADCAKVTFAASDAQSTVTVGVI